MGGGRGGRQGPPETKSRKQGVISGLSAQG